MTKAILISGCSTCPYARNRVSTSICIKYNIELGVFDKVPTEPHPQCKLPDLPTSEFAVNAAMTASHRVLDLKSVEFGANFIINKLK